MQKQFVYIFDNKEYIVQVTYKRSRTISYRFKNDVFVVYAPIFTSEKTIRKGLDKFALKLIKENAHNTGETSDYIYILGHKINKKDGQIVFSNGDLITFKDDIELHKKLKKWFLKIMTNRTRYYEGLMGAYENKISVRDMSTRYGSNTPSHHSIRYSTVLMHFDYEVIDAIVVHELAHCFIHGHSDKFYELVLKYCPNYYMVHKRLRKGIFNATNN